MNRIKSYFVCVPLSVCALATVSQAALIVSDPFSYPTGSVVGDNGGTGFSSGYTGSASNNIVSPGLTYTYGSGNTLASFGFPIRPPARTMIPPNTINY